MDKSNLYYKIYGKIIYFNEHNLWKLKMEKIDYSVATLYR